MNPTITNQTPFNPEQGPSQERPSETFGLDNDIHQNPSDSVDFDGMEDAIKKGRTLTDANRQRQIAEGMVEAGFTPDESESSFKAELDEVLPKPEGTTPVTESIGETAVSDADPAKVD